MYSSSTPKPAKRCSGGGLIRGGLVGCRCREPASGSRERRETASGSPVIVPVLGLFDALEEDQHESLVELVAEDGVLDAGVHAGVVVDLHDVALLAAFLDVHAVEAVAD